MRGFLTSILYGECRVLLLACEAWAQVLIVVSSSLFQQVIHRQMRGAMLPAVHMMHESCVWAAQRLGNSCTETRHDTSTKFASHASSCYHRAPALSGGHHTLYHPIPTSPSPSVAEGCIVHCPRAHWFCAMPASRISGLEEDLVEASGIFHFALIMSALVAFSTCPFSVRTAPELRSILRFERFT